MASSPPRARLSLAPPLDGRTMDSIAPPHNCQRRPPSRLEGDGEGSSAQGHRGDRALPYQQQVQHQPPPPPPQLPEPEEQQRPAPDALSSLATTGSRIMERARPKTQSPSWFALELLKRTDLSSGDICMFHYPMDFFPQLEVNGMGSALEMISEGRIGPVEEETGNGDVDMANASLVVRNQVTRIQFSWYQFQEFPRDALGRAYANLRHLDVRQNASLTCIDSIITQLPQLMSLNLSDCPNIRTLAPLAQFGADDVSLDARMGDDLDDPPVRRTLNLRHLWVRGCNLRSMEREEWADVFDALAMSSGPLERLTLSRNNMSYLHGNVGKLKRLTYLFVEDNEGGVTMKSNAPVVGFEVPDELGELTGLRFVSFCGNNLTALPRTMGRLHDSCDLYLHRNPNLAYPPAMYQRSVKSMRQFFHQERMALLRGAVLFMPHRKRARWRANERIFSPGGTGYFVCKDRFEETARRTSITLMSD